MNFKKIVAYCGLTCKSCPIYWASKEPDKKIQKKMKTKIAQLCNEHYGTNYDQSDITDCNGCRTESGILFSGCLTCEVRKCVKEKNLETCALCPDYICTKLKKLYQTDSTGKIWLDIIRSTM